jgi:hypothetical protein
MCSEDKRSQLHIDGKSWIQILVGRISVSSLNVCVTNTPDKILYALDTILYNARLQTNSTSNQRRAATVEGQIVVKL